MAAYHQGYLHKYIPAGSIRIHPLEPDIIKLNKEWRVFSNDSTTVDVQSQSEAYFALAIQTSVLASAAVRPYLKLFERQWIKFEFRNAMDDDGTGVLRVYILGDDVDRTAIDRSNTSLQRSKKELLAALDYSQVTWHGYCKHDGVPTLPSPPRLKAGTDITSADTKDMSLLEMFNKIPSPNPNIQLIRDPYTKLFMAELLSGTITGLVTELYPYQTRSAALMLQREAEQGQVLDPRLIPVADQHGGTCYMNTGGEILRGPRYYDEVCGGILAEEMGAGKTLVCLALISATKDESAAVPDMYQGSNVTIRPKVGSLVDMAAAVVTKNAIPWKRDPPGTISEHCIAAIDQNPGWYYLPRPEARTDTRRGSRLGQGEPLPHSKIFLSHASLIVVPSNLLQQWRQEISKHTEGLKVLVLGRSKDPIPPIPDILAYDIILCTVSRLEMLWAERQAERDGSWRLISPIARIQFKRCIVDEGHKLGNVRLTGAKTTILEVIDCLQITARWIVTGTPSQGLFGVEEGGSRELVTQSSHAQEQKDIERIGSIAASYLKAQPWSSNAADWKVYVMQPKTKTMTTNSFVGNGPRGTLRSTFNSLIIRHRLSEVSKMLPSVEHKTIRLEGSYQDKLCLNLFSMMIIFNAVQSQRTDQDYFFHKRNQKSLLQLLHNLRQASFFGGSFFSPDEIYKSVETAETFSKSSHVKISEADAQLLQEAIGFGKQAFRNKVKEAANRYHEMPIYVQDFPGDSGAAWSMDGKGEKLICTNWRLVRAAQKLLSKWVDSTEQLNTYFNSGNFALTGKDECEKAMEEIMPQKANKEKALSGNTSIGQDQVTPRKQASIDKVKQQQDIPTPPKSPEPVTEIAEPLAKTQIVSTCSAKLSYLVDAIVTHQKDEQMIVFYENDNVAWYLAGQLEMLSVRHLIYAKGITSARRAQYVSTFNSSTKFRVLLMDISQAAFGLDMRSASRIYFINPVLNPQVEAQAIGRVRRISQQKKVTVETLVLRGSLEEVIMERKSNMTQAEHRECKTILDDRPIYNWILNPKIIPLPDVDVLDGPNQMAPLAAPQFVFGREFGRERSSPDEDILIAEPVLDRDAAAVGAPATPTPAFRGGGKRKRVGFGDEAPTSIVGAVARPAKRFRFVSPTPGAAVSSTASSPAPSAPAAEEEGSMHVRFA